MSDTCRIFMLFAALLFSSPAATRAQDAQKQAVARDETPENEQKEPEPEVPETPPDAPPWNRFATRWVPFQPTGGIALDFVRYAQDERSLGHVGDLTEFEVPEVRAVRAGVLGTINFEKPWFFYVAGAYRGFGRGFDRDKAAAWGLFDLSLTISAGKLGRIKTKGAYVLSRVSYANFPQQTNGNEVLRINHGFAQACGPIKAA